MIKTLKVPCPYSMGPFIFIFEIQARTMNIREAILEEHSKKQTLKIVKYIGNDPARFAELVRIFLGDEYRVTQRAAWVVSHCIQQHPELAKPHLEKFIKNLAKPGLHDAVKRNTLKVLEDIDIPGKMQGPVVDLCFKVLAGQDPVAIKVYAMTALVNICRKEPELKNEVKMVIEEILPFGSPAILSRGKRTLKELEKL